VISGGAWIGQWGAVKLQVSAAAESSRARQVAEEGLGPVAVLEEAEHARGKGGRAVERLGDVAVMDEALILGVDRRENLDRRLAVIEMRLVEVVCAV